MKRDYEIVTHLTIFVIALNTIAHVFPNLIVPIAVLDILFVLLSLLGFLMKLLVDDRTGVLLSFVLMLLSLTIVILDFVVTL